MFGINDLFQWERFVTPTVIKVFYWLAIVLFVLLGIAEFKALQPLPDTGDLRDDLLAALRGWIRAVTRTPAGGILAGLIAEAQHDPGLADAWRARVIGPLRAQHLIMLRRAIDRGELPASTDTEVALDLLYGSAYHRLLNGHQPLNDTFARHVVDIIVAGLGAVPAA